MGGGGKYRRSKTSSKRKTRKKTSKYAGKHLNDELRETLGGLTARLRNKEATELFEADNKLTRREELMIETEKKRKRKEEKIEERKEKVKKIRAEREKIELRETESDVVGVKKGSGDEEQMGETSGGGGELNVWREEKKINLTLREMEVSKTEERLVKALILKNRSKGQSSLTDGAQKLEGGSDGTATAVVVRDGVDRQVESAEAGVYDLWSEGKTAVSKTKTGEGKRKRSKKPETAVASKIGRVDSKFAPVKVVHPGCSFNPSQKDHLESLKKVIEKERTRIESEKTTKSFYYLFKGIPHPEHNDTLVNYEGLQDDADESESEEEKETSAEVAKIESNDGKQSRRVKTPTKKTRTQRNRMKRVKAILTSVTQRKKEKRFKHELHSFKTILKEVKQDEKKDAERVAQQIQLRKEKEENREPEVRFNGKVMKNKLDNVEALLPSDMTRTKTGAPAGSEKLRNMIPHGNLLRDRFYYMQSRNMFATGGPTQRRKKKMVKTIVRGKNFIGNEKVKPTPKGTKRTERLISPRQRIR